MPPADPRGTDPEDRNPRDPDLSRRSAERGAIGPWLIVGAMILLGFGVYVLSAVL